MEQELTNILNKNDSNYRIKIIYEGPNHLMIGGQNNQQKTILVTPVQKIVDINKLNKWYESFKSKTNIGTCISKYNSFRTFKEHNLFSKNKYYLKTPTHAFIKELPTQTPRGGHDLMRISTYFEINPEIIKIRADQHFNYLNELFNSGLTKNDLYTLFEANKREKRNIEKILEKST